MFNDVKIRHNFELYKNYEPFVPIRIIYIRTKCTILVEDSTLTSNKYNKFRLKFFQDFFLICNWCFYIFLKTHALFIKEQHKKVFLS
jgi:hypothetical protein